MACISDYLAKEDYLAHHGILGQKWGIRRFQNPDGTRTEAGKERYRSASEVAEEVKKQIAPNLLKLDAIDEASGRFNELGDELAKDYDDYYKSLKNNKKFKNDVLSSMKNDFGAGCDDDDLFDFVKDEYVDKMLKAYEPKILTDKVKQFFTAGDEYFDQLESFADPIIKSYKDQGVDGVTKKYAGSIEKIEIYVKDLLSSDVQWNAYMYRHFDDYWVQDVESKYDLANSITMDDYNEWAEKYFGHN